MTQDQKHGNRLAFLGTLAAGLAHEIKNPLSTIGMNLQLIREDWKDPETDRERRLVRKLDVLVREVGRLETILDDFLRFAGGMKLTLSKISPHQIVDEVLEFLAPRLFEAGVEVRCVPPDRLPPVLVDRGAFKQVFLNLFLNAMQAMPRGGELMIRTRASEDGREVVFEVTDTGEGIPAELLDRIWQVYYTRRKTGTGMGLPTARRIVEEHDGTISVVSEVGKGTSFCIRLPVAGDEETR